MPAKVAALNIDSASQIPRRRRNRLPAEWWPRQHGAWVMLFLPFVVGVVLRLQEVGFKAFVVPLLMLWLVGYFAFHVLSLWLKARNKSRYLLPLQVYGGLSVVLGGLVLWLEPTLWQWSAVYVPLLGIGLWQAWKGDESALLGRFVTAIAACLICAVTFSDGLVLFVQGLGQNEGFRRAASATLILMGYFLGTVLFVKTMIRERGSQQFLRYSVAFHAVIAVMALGAAWSGQVAWLVPMFFLAATIRAAVLPLLKPNQGKAITPKQVGLTEFGFSVALLLLLTVR